MGMTANQGMGYGSIAQGLVSAVGAFAADEQLRMRSDAIDRSLAFQEWYTRKQIEDARRRGDITYSQARQASRKEVSALRASFAGQGVDVSVGSALLAQLEEESLGMIDAATIRNNVAKEVLGLTLEAEALRGQRAIEQATLRAERVATYAAGAAEAGGALIQAYGFFKKDAAPTPKQRPEEAVFPRLGGVRRIPIRGGG
jgi:hypothetical protein